MMMKKMTMVTKMMRTKMRQVDNKTKTKMKRKARVKTETKIKRKRKMMKNKTKSCRLLTFPNDSLLQNSNSLLCWIRYQIYPHQLTILLAVCILPTQALENHTTLTMQYSKPPISQKFNRLKCLNLLPSQELWLWKIKTLKSTWSLRLSYNRLSQWDRTL